MESMTAKEFIGMEVPVRLNPISVEGGGTLYVKEMTDAEIQAGMTEERKMKASKGAKYGAKGTLKRVKCQYALAIVLAVYDPETLKPLFSKSQIPEIATNHTLSGLKDINTKIQLACLGLTESEADDPNA